MVQIAVADPTARKGQLVQGPWPLDLRSSMCEGALAAGNLVDYGTDPLQQVREIPALPAVDVDAIATAAVIASAVTAQTITSGTFDGVVGADRISPCRTVSVNWSASADWDTPSGECRVDIYGYGNDGNKVKDSVARPNSGALAVARSTRIAFSSIVSVDIEACNGVGGTATIGLSNDRVALSLRDYPGVAVYEMIKEPNTAAREYADNEQVEVLHRGVIATIPEHAVSVGDDVYVRVLEAGADLRGQFTGQDGAATPGTYAHLAGARWTSAAAADGMAHLELRGA